MHGRILGADLENLTLGTKGFFIILSHVTFYKIIFRA